MATVTHPFPCPFRRDRAGVTAFAVCVGVALAVPWRGGRPAAAAHSAVARLDRACLVAGRIVEIRLDGGFCASQPTGDLRDRQTLLVAVVAGELRRAAPFGHTVEHQIASLPEVLDSQPKRKKRGPSGEGFSSCVAGRLSRGRRFAQSGSVGAGLAWRDEAAGVARYGSLLAPRRRSGRSLGIRASQAVVTEGPLA